jgi:hypothetical protein
LLGTDQLLIRRAGHFIVQAMGEIEKTQFKSSAAVTQEKPKGFSRLSSARAKR